MIKKNKNFHGQYRETLNNKIGMSSFHMQTKRFFFWQKKGRSLVKNF